MTLVNPAIVVVGVGALSFKGELAAPKAYKPIVVRVTDGALNRESDLESRSTYQGLVMSVDSRAWLLYRPT